MTGPIRVRPTKGPVDVARLQRIEDYVNWYFEQNQAEIDKLVATELMMRPRVAIKEPK